MYGVLADSDEDFDGEEEEGQSHEESAEGKKLVLQYYFLHNIYIRLKQFMYVLGVSINSSI